MDTNRTRAREAALAKSDQLDHWHAYADAMFALGLALGLALDYPRAFQLGHDTGLGARQDTRELVRGIIDGYSAGCRARHELIAELLGKGDTCPTSASAADTRPPPSPRPPTPPAAPTPSTSPG